MYIGDRKNEKREGKDGVWMRRKAKERKAYMECCWWIKKRQLDALSVGEGTSRGGKVCVLLKTKE